MVTHIACSLRLSTISDTRLTWTNTFFRPSDLHFILTFTFFKFFRPSPSSNPHILQTFTFRPSPSSDLHIFRILTFFRPSPSSDLHILQTFTFFRPSHSSDLHLIMTFTLFRPSSSYDLHILRHSPASDLLVIFNKTIVPIQSQII